MYFWGSRYRYIRGPWEFLKAVWTDYIGNPFEELRCDVQVHRTVVSWGPVRVVVTKTRST